MDDNKLREKNRIHFEHLNSADLLTAVMNMLQNERKTLFFFKQESGNILSQQLFLTLFLNLTFRLKYRYCSLISPLLSFSFCCTMGILINGYCNSGTVLCPGIP